MAEEQADKLEQALLERANELAREQISHAEDERERLLHVARERLQQRRQQQQQQLLELGERHYRQQLQAADLQNQARLERLRWTLIESTLNELESKLQALLDDEQRYGEVLEQWLDEAAAALPGVEEAELQLNQRDSERFAARLGGRYRLSDEPLADVGGLVLRSSDGRMRYDNSFSGRRKRLGDDLFRVVNDRLFGSEANLGRQRGR